MSVPKIMVDVVLRFSWQLDSREAYSEESEIEQDSGATKDDVIDRAFDAYLSPDENDHFAVVEKTIKYLDGDGREITFAEYRDLAGD